MTDIQIFDLTPENIADFGICGYKDMKKHLELRRKIDWIKKYYPKGLRIKALLSKKVVIKECLSTSQANTHTAQ